MYSITALRLGIENEPNSEQLSNMKLVAENIFEPIRKDFDQMIWEFGNNDNPDWVHVSYVSPEKNRNRCLKAYRKNGKTKYMVI